MKAFFNALTVFFILTFALHAGEIRLKGKLIGADGKPMAAANVQVFDYKTMGDPLVKLVTVTKDGNFDFTLPSGASYSINFMGANHDALYLNMPVHVDKGEVEFDVKLTAFFFAPYPEAVSVYSNVTDLYTPMEMKRQSDGTYTIDINNDWSDTVTVKVNGFTGYFNAVIPGVGEGIKLDEDGTYANYFTKKGLISIKVDPSKFVNLPQSPYAELKIKSGDPVLSKIVQLTYEFSVNYITGQVPVIKSDLEGFRASDDKNLKDFYLSRLLVLYDLYRYVDVKEIPVLYKSLSTDSPYWQTLTYQIRDFMKYIPHNEKTDFLTELFNKQNDPLFRLEIINYMRLAPSYFTEAKITEFENKYKEIYKGTEYEGYIDGGGGYYPEGDPDAHGGEASNLGVGNEIPDFSFTTIADSPVTYSKESLKGKYYILDFWATWCMPCMEEVPTLKSAYAEFKEKGLEIISVAVNDDLKTVKSVVGKNKMDWSISFLEAGATGDKVASDFNIMYIPHLFLVSPEGNIVAVTDQLRGKNLAETLRTYLQ